MSSMDLHRVLIELHSLGSNPKLLPMPYLQYYFDGEEHKVNLKSHGNSKYDCSPYKKSAPRIKTLSCHKLTPKQIEREILEEKGGLLMVKSACEMPRTRKQIAHYKNDKTYSDMVLACVSLSKGQAFAFVRDVREGPEFTVFIATDAQ